MALSGNLEVDEAQFVGATGFKLGFGNSHPPLYHWLVTLAYAATGGSWVASVALVKNALLAGHFILAWDLVRRLKASPVDGLLAASALTLLPQVIWQGQVTLAHSVAVGFAALATLHALCLWLTRPRLVTALWLGSAIAIGALSKYNYLLFAVTLAVAAWSLPAIRVRMDRRTAWLAAGVAIAAFLPHGIWALVNFRTSVERLGKLYSERDRAIPFDLPILGIDGLASLVLAFLAWAGPLILVWGGLVWVHRRTGRRDDEGWDFAGDFAAVCGRAALIALALFAAAVLFADMHKVHERYLTPMLMPGVIWLVLRFPLGSVPLARVVLPALAAVLFVASLVAIPATVAFGPSRLAYPYAAIADDLAATDVVPTDVLAHRHDLAANVALRLPDGAPWIGPANRRVAILWRRGPQAPPFLVDRLGEVYRWEGPAIVHTHPYDNWSGRSVTIRSQMFQRVD